MALCTWWYLRANPPRALLSSCHTTVGIQCKVTGVAPLTSLRRPNLAPVPGLMHGLIDHTKVKVQGEKLYNQSSNLWKVGLPKHRSCLQQSCIMRQSQQAIAEESHTAARVTLSRPLGTCTSARRFGYLALRFLP